MVLWEARLESQQVECFPRFHRLLLAASYKVVRLLHQVQNGLKGGVRDAARHMDWTQARYAGTHHETGRAGKSSCRDRQADG